MEDLPTPNQMLEKAKSGWALISIVLKTLQNGGITLQKNANVMGGSGGEHMPLGFSSGLALR